MLSILKRHDLGVVILIFIGILSASPSSAAVRRMCLVSYQTQYGWSDEHVVEVQFATGQELNKASKTYDYGMYEKYALIWFGEGKIAIIKLDSYVMAGRDLDGDEFERMFNYGRNVSGRQVNGQDRQWKFRGKTYTKWVDPRLNDY